jgi:membrane protein implicated in regulation of membrane protease activity
VKRAAAALRALIVNGLGLEGFLLIAGTAALAVGASYLGPAGPWLVVGGVAVLLGLATAIAPRPAPPETSPQDLGLTIPPEVR